MFAANRVGGLHCEEWITYCYQSLELWDMANCSRAPKKVLKTPAEQTNLFISVLVRRHRRRNGEYRKVWARKKYWLL